MASNPDFNDSMLMYWASGTPTEIASGQPLSESMKRWWAAQAKALADEVIQLRKAATGGPPAVWIVRRHDPALTEDVLIGVYDTSEKAWAAVDWDRPTQALSIDRMEVQ